MSGIKAFLFDLDYTLVDSSEAIVAAVKHVMNSKGYSCENENVGKLIGTPLEKMFRILIPRLSDEEIWECVDSYRKYYLTRHLGGTYLYPHVEKTLRELKQRDFKLGLVTSKWKKPVLEVLDHFHLKTLFDVIVTGCEVKKHKPAPDIMFEVAQRLGVDPSECVVVGDSSVDVEAARRAECLTIVILTGRCTRQQLESAKPDVTLESLELLASVVEGITAKDNN